MMHTKNASHNASSRIPHMPIEPQSGTRKRASATLMDTDDMAGSNKLNDTEATTLNQKVQSEVRPLSQIANAMSRAVCYVAPRDTVDPGHTA